MIKERITIDSDEITMGAEEGAEIKVLVNDEVSLSMPLVYKNQLTIHLTLAGLAALEAENEFRYDDIEEVEFEGND